MSEDQIVRNDGPAPITFQDHKEITAADCETIAKLITDLAARVRDGDVKAFERFWIEGGTEEGDAKVCGLRELIVMRYLSREDRLN